MQQTALCNTKLIIIMNQYFSTKYQQKKIGKKKKTD